MVSYVLKRNKCVIKFSSMHRNTEIDEESGDRNKPSVITCSNSTKNTVDVVDIMCVRETRCCHRLFLLLWIIDTLNAHNYSQS